MRRHVLTLRAVFTALTAVVSLTVLSVAGQTPATRAKASTPAKGGVSRTADGHPDLQGLLYTAAPAK